MPPYFDRQSSRQAFIQASQEMARKATIGCHNCHEVMTETQLEANVPMNRQKCFNCGQTGGVYQKQPGQQT